MVNQLCKAFLVTSIIAALARRRKSLSLSGAAAALVAGTLILGIGGWPWGGLLALFFITSSLLSHFQEDKKRETAAEKFAKGHERDWGQVVANGGVGTITALVSLLIPLPIWFPAYIGVMAAVTADTWATEVGTLSRQQPRLLTTGQPVTVGTSGGITPFGTFISFCGGLLIGVAAALFTRSPQKSRLALIGAVSGLVGSLFDSLLGATVQQIFYCDSCQKETERLHHSCGRQTRPMRGWPWLNNDVVNFAASLVGGITAVLLWLLFIHRNRNT